MIGADSTDNGFKPSLSIYNGQDMPRDSRKGIIPQLTTYRVGMLADYPIVRDEKTLLQHGFQIALQIQEDINYF